jgi:hypothetical protein
MALTFNNKTPNISPTIYNNQRILAKGVNDANYLYETFMAGVHPDYEVWFRRSTDNGSNWDAPKRLSIGNLENRYPCITVSDEGSYDGLHVVWQKKKDNGKYDIYYSKSTNSGNTWQTPILLNDGEITCSSSQTYGPMPVIASIRYGTILRHAVVWVTSGGLRYRIWDSGWGSVGSLDDGSINYRVWRPSIAGTNYFGLLTYDTRGYGVYSRKFTGTGFSSRVRVDNIGDYDSDRASQVAIFHSSPDHYAAWERFHRSSGKYRIVCRYGINHVWNSTYTEWGDASTHLKGPTLTTYGFPFDPRAFVLYYSYNNQIRESTLGSSTYSTWDTDSRFPNITHPISESGNPRRIWIKDQASNGPYNIHIQSSGTPKSNKVNQMAYHRRAGIENHKDQTGLYIEVGEIEAVRKNGEKVPLEFKPIDKEREIELTASNLMDYLAIDEISLPSDVEKLQFYAEVFTGAQRDTLEEKKTNFKDFDVHFRITDKGSDKSYSTTRQFSNADGDVEFKQSMVLDVSNLAGREIVFKPEVSGFEINDEKYTFSLGHIYIAQHDEAQKAMSGAHAEPALPEQFMLQQNIPNPFNPETEIRYSIPEEGRITLKIYDLLGKEIITLADGVKSAGHYRVQWNSLDQHGNPVPSGVYVYRLTCGNHVEQKKMILIK